MHHRAQQQQESIGYFDWFWSIFRGGRTPTKEKVLEMQEQVETRLVLLESENDSLQGMVQKLKGEVRRQEAEAERRVGAEHNKRLDDLKELRNQHKDNNSILHNQYSKEIAKANRERDVARDAAHHLQTKYGASEKNCEEYSKQLEELRSISRQQKSSGKSNKKYEEEIVAMRSTIQTLQTARLQSVESAHWAPHATSTVENRLTSIVSEVRKWSQKHVHWSFEDMLDPENFRAAATRLMQRGCILDPDHFRISLIDSEAMQKENKAAAMFAGAAASFDIMQKIIGDPYFAFVGSSQEKLLRESQRKTFFALQSLIGPSKSISIFYHDKLILTGFVGDEAGAEGLRCQLLRLLDPVTNRDDVDVKAIKAISKASRDEAVTQLATSLCTEWIGDKAEWSTQAQAELESIVKVAAELSWSIWTRKTVVEVLDWRIIAQMYGSSAQAYNAESKCFSLHPLNNKDVDDEPDALDGRSPVLMYSPMMLARGNADGKDYDKPVTVKKAVVWMGEKKDGETSFDA